MLKIIITFLSGIIIGTINTLGYWGILLLMALESCNIPIPSEVILPYGGFLVSQNQMNIHLAALAGGIGCLIGSIVSYYLGRWLGRPLLWKYGKWFLISQKDIKRSDKFLKKFGSATYFFSRLLPVVRTFISFVAGVSAGHDGNFKKFCFYTFIGSWIWSYVLIYFGVKLGDNWASLGPWWDKFHEAIIIVILIFIVWHIYRVFRDSRSKDEVEEVL